MFWAALITTNKVYKLFSTVRFFLLIPKYCSQLVSFQIPNLGNYPSIPAIVWNCEPSKTFGKFGAVMEDPDERLLFGMRKNGLNSAAVLSPARTLHFLGYSQHTPTAVLDMFTTGMTTVFHSVWGSCIIGTSSQVSFFFMIWIERAVKKMECGCSAGLHCTIRQERPLSHSDSLNGLNNHLLA